MSQSSQSYTYRAGQKLAIEKRPDQFVVRVLPDQLQPLGIVDAEQVSSASSRVTTRAADLEPLMSQSRHLAPTHHAYYVAETSEEFLITDRVLVSFHDILSPEQVAAFAGRYGLVQKTAYSERDFLFQLTDHTGMNPVKLVVLLNEQEPLVASAEHDLNQRMTTYQFALPTDPAYAREWHLHTRYSAADFDPRASSRCEIAWQMLNHFGSADVVVGITDDGCKLDHADLNSATKFAGWGYFRGERLIINTDINARASEMYKRGADHGTACAGVIAGEADAVLTVGAAPGCRLLPIQWESSGSSLFISDSKLLTALNFIADRVDVLSNSWGAVPNSLWSVTVVRRITELARSGGRRGRGIIFLWAAGNENCPIEHSAAVDVPYTNGWSFKSDGTPIWIGVRTTRQFRNNLAGIPGLMHVAALASTAQRSHYSNYGSGVVICAPTSNVHEYHRLRVSGLGITTTIGPGDDVTNEFGGTSSATPLVAGIAALIISANSDLTALDVVSILKQTASKDLSLQGYPRTPAASYDPNPVWDVSPVAPFNQGNFQDIGTADGTWSPWFGHGRADAANAVAEALRRRSGPQVSSLRKSSMPGLSIPDNDATGVSDRISFTETQVISALKVTVDITHSYIGDLRVILSAPSGVSVILHDRNGGSTHDLQRTFDLTTTPSLTALAGTPIAGDWTLIVQDLARQDLGRLNRWELEIQTIAADLVILEEAPGVTIPDNDPNGIERVLTVTTSGHLKQVEISVDITHTYIGDLQVKLVSPAGTIVPLHQRSGGKSDNLIKTYTGVTTPALQALINQMIQGTWKLQVADLESRDVGKLNRWALKIVCEQ